jgi:hypothetical protein
MAYWNCNEMWAPWAHGKYVSRRLDVHSGQKISQKIRDPINIFAVLMLFWEENILASSEKVLDKSDPGFPFSVFALAKQSFLEDN